MSDRIPERSEIVRSSLITITLAVVPLILAIAFWAWSSPDIIDQTIVGTINDINPYITYVLEIVFMALFFFFMTVTIVNLRLFTTKVRAGWAEVVLMLIVTTVLSYAMFGAGVMGATTVFCLAFVVYLYLLQE
jgi:uncharacterized membrane protein YwzB